MQLGWFAAPIFSSIGNYPSLMIEQINKNSEREGRTWSRLPTFSEKWVDKIRGSADFLGLNYYTSRYVDLIDEPSGVNPSYSGDMQLNLTVKPEWKQSASNYLYSVPQGLGDILRYFIYQWLQSININFLSFPNRWMKKEYNNPAVFITENGWSDKGEMEDNDRIEYLHDHLHQALNAVVNDNCNLKGYTGKIDPENLIIL